MKQYLKLHPISVPPKKSGWYTVCDAKGMKAVAARYNGIGWRHQRKHHTHWLSNAPVEGVLVSEEDLREAIMDAWFSEIGHSDEKETVNRIINFLTSKAK